MILTDEAGNGESLKEPTPRVKERVGASIHRGSEKSSSRKWVSGILSSEGKRHKKRAEVVRPQPPKWPTL